LYDIENIIDNSILCQDIILYRFPSDATGISNSSIRHIHIPNIKSPCARENNQRDFYCQLELYHVDSLWTFGTLFNIEANGLTLGKGFKSVALDARIVDEDITTLFGSEYLLCISCMKIN